MDNPQVNEALGKIVTWLGEKLPQAGDFVISEAPSVIRQIIYLDIARSSVIAVLSAIGIIILYRLYKQCIFLTTDCDTEAVGVIGIVLSGTAIIVLAITISCQIYNMTGPIFAPKAYLLERIGVLR